MKSEKEIRDFRNGLYQAALTMRAKKQKEHSLILTYVRLLDFVLEDKNDFSLSGFNALLNKFDWDSVFTK
jgi:hypothetical protein